MEQQKALGTARLIATLTYAAPLVIFPWVGRMAIRLTPLEPKVQGILAPALLFVGVTDYVISLLVEARLLAQAREAGAARSVVTAAVVTSAFGASLAVYGLVVTLLGAPAWGAALYLLCAVHGLHLMMRWPSYAAAAEPGDSSGMPGAC
jgi:F0F1-type ATP synthase membrane subunit c/vacuolar-type H+-ATPase subunit K